MPAQKGKGFVPPDRSKSYAVVEKPTAGDNKGKITKTYATDLSWDEAQKLKHAVAVKRYTKFAAVVEMSELNVPLPHQTTDDRVELASVMASSGLSVDGISEEYAQELERVQARATSFEVKDGVVGEIEKPQVEDDLSDLLGDDLADIERAIAEEEVLVP